jgi:hypothetical protein
MNTRRGMKPRTLRRACAVIALVAMPLVVPLSAHRVDEYLQAAQVSIGPEQVRLNLYLTPGTAVLAAVVAAIDQSGDRHVSDDEARAYAAGVLGQLSMALDGVSIPLELLAFDYPDADALAAGRGSILVSAAGRMPRPAVGEHLLVLHNGFRTPESVYLANAMVSRDPTLTILGQERDADQTRLTIRYRLERSVPVWLSVPFVMAGVVVVSGMVLALWFRRTLTPAAGRQETL